MQAPVFPVWISLTAQDYQRRMANYAQLPFEKGNPSSNLEYQLFFFGRLIGLYFDEPWQRAFDFYEFFV